MYAAIVYAQPMFIPRTRNIYPRTPTFTPRTPTFIPRTPTVGADLSCPNITEYTVWITVYNQCFTHVQPIWCVVVFIQFGVNGHDKSDPYAYGMCAAIVYVQSMFIPRTRNIYPRTPIMICGCIYTIRHETGAMNRPLRLRYVLCYCLCTTTFTPRTRNIYPRTPTFTHVHPL